MKDEKVELTRQERLEYWQLCRIVLDYKYRRVTKQEAFEQFCRQLKLPVGVGQLLFPPMVRMTVQELKQAFPDWIKKEMEPTFEDLTHAKRRGCTGQAG